VKDAVVRFQQLKIPPQFIGKNYDQDGEYLLQFQGWINQFWQDKDALLAQMHRPHRWQASSYRNRAAHKKREHLKHCRSWLASDGDFKDTKKPADDHSSAGFSFLANA